jgi:uncharacterized membrane protein YpjA
MATTEGLGARFEEQVATYFDADLPAEESLPRYVAPLPTWVENVGLRLAVPIALANLLGTIFGFWYYAGRFLELSPPLIEGQLGATAVWAWPLVPDSPMATLFIGLSLLAWRLDWDVPWLHALALFGCIKLGGWTPFVQVLIEGQAGIPLWLWHFLVWSHLAMVAEAFLIHRYADFPVRAVALALGWFALNDVVDYFVSPTGEPLHTWLGAEFVDGAFAHTLPAHDLAAAGAVVLTLAATFLALATRVEKERRDLV